MESEIGEYQKTLDEMSTAMANLHQEDYGTGETMQDCQQAIGASCESSRRPGKFEAEAQQMCEAEMNAYQYGEKKGYGVERYDTADATS